MKDTNYYRAKGSYSRPGAEAKKAAKEPAFVDAKGPGEEGTDELVNNYTKGTPGQDTNWRSVKEAKQGLWANIHAKRKRIASGSGEKMRKKDERRWIATDAEDLVRRALGVRVRRRRRFGASNLLRDAIEWVQARRVLVQRLDCRARRQR